jgi:hypothetical protein
MKSLVKGIQNSKSEKSNLFITVLLRSNRLPFDSDVRVIECIDFEIARRRSIVQPSLREGYFPIGCRDWVYGISALNVCSDSGLFHSEVNDQMIIF